MCLDYESLRLPETSIFKWNGYKPYTAINFTMKNNRHLGKLITLQQQQNLKSL
jgi:hypothetical protein